jgi:hypothetical protein
MNRAQRRALMKTKKQKTSTEVDEKLGLFDKIPEECLTCLKPFDKKNKQMVMTWSVVVREQQEAVRLYCPTCWKKAQDFIMSTESSHKPSS